MMASELNTREYIDILNGWMNLDQWAGGMESQYDVDAAKSKAWQEYLAAKKLGQYPENPDKKPYDLFDEKGYKSNEFLNSLGFLGKLLSAGYNVNWGEVGRLISESGMNSTAFNEYLRSIGYNGDFRDGLGGDISTSNPGDSIHGAPDLNTGGPGGAPGAPGLGGLIGPPTPPPLLPGSTFSWDYSGGPVTLTGQNPYAMMPIPPAWR